jgi:hypothetical protein
MAALGIALFADIVIGSLNVKECSVSGRAFITSDSAITHGVLCSSPGPMILALTIRRTRVCDIYIYIYIYICPYLKFLNSDSDFITRQSSALIHCAMIVVNVSESR